MSPFKNALPKQSVLDGYFISKVEMITEMSSVAI